MNNTVNISRFTQSGTKDDFWQFVRGICIIAVILIHCPILSNEYLMTVTRQLINFPVIVFYFISGYFSNTDKYMNQTKSYILKRIGRLFVPYLIWSVISFIYQIIILKNIDSAYTYIYNLLLGKAVVPFYYVICLLQLTLITPILIWAINKKGWLNKLLWFVTPVYLLIVAYVFRFINCDCDFLTFFSEEGTTFFPAGLFFYYLGLNVRMNDNIKEKLINRFGHIYLIFIAFLLELVESFVMLYFGYSSSGQFKISSYFYGFIICICFLKYSQVHKLSSNIISDKNNTSKALNKLYKFIVYVGDNSYGIFLIHIFVRHFPLKVFEIIGLDHNILKIIFCFLAMLFLSLFVIKIVQFLAKALHLEKALKWIGF